MMQRLKATVWMLALGTCAAPLCGQVISTVAGTNWSFPATPLQAVNAPLGPTAGVALDTKGNVYLTDSFNGIGNSMVMRIGVDGTLTIVAGNGTKGFSGDGGPATSAALDDPKGVTVDAAGNIYIADAGNNRIRKVSDGFITTVAGGGPRGFSGDGGPAGNAGLSGPLGVAVDSAGNLYIADYFNNRIRRVSNGIITTVAGSGTPGFSGDGGPALTATLNGPGGVAVDLAGNIYVADTANNCVRKIAGGIISTAMTGLFSPSGVAVDSAGRLYVAEPASNRIRVFSGGGLHTVAGNGKSGLSGDGGPAVNAELDFPLGVAVDSAGTIFIADTVNARIRKVSNGTITTLGGNGGYKFSGDGGAARAAAIHSPQGVAVDSSDDLYIADYDNQRIRKVSRGIITTVAGNGMAGFSGEGGPGTDAALLAPSGVAVDSEGNLYIADTGNQRVRKVSGGIITTVAGKGSFGFSGDGGPATNAELDRPRGLAVDSEGVLYIADYGNSRIRKVSGGIITTVAGNGTPGFSGDGGPATSAALDFPSGVAVDSVGNLYIADTLNNRVREVSGGVITTIAGNGGFGFSDGGPATSAPLAGPEAIVADSANNLYIAETPSNRIRKVSGGIITTVAGIGDFGPSGDGGPATGAALFFPGGVALDSTGNLYVADSGDDRIREVFAGAVSYQVAPGNLSFSASASGNAPGTQTINLSSIAGLAFTASMSDTWLRVSPSSGSIPAALQVSVDPSGLQPGTYQGTVTINSPLANPATQPVSVTLTVSAASPPKVAVQPTLLSLSAPEGSPLAEKTAFVSNTGSGSLTFNATASSDQGWLSLTIVNSTAIPTAPGSLTITANPTGLGASTGPYKGSIEITSPTTGEAITVPVTLAITPSSKPQVLLSQTGMSFRTSVASGDLPQCFAVLNAGQGTLNFSLSSDADWLKATQQNCPYRAVSSQSAISEVVVAITTKGLNPGEYEGHIQITAPDAENSPQNVKVTLTLLGSGTPVGPIVRPSGLVFTGVAGGDQPGSLDVTIFNPTINAFGYNSGSVTLDALNWFSYLPTSGNVQPFPAAPPAFHVYTDLSQLTPNSYRGGITLVTRDFGLRTIDVLAVVAPGASPKPNLTHAAAPACSPTILNAIFTQVEAEFTARVGKAFPIELYLADDCGSPLATGSVVVGFSNEDPAISLVPLGDGRWAGTWLPSNAADSSRVQITVRAQIPESGVSGTAQRNGGLR